MVLLFPYTYISCPCSDVSRRVTVPKRSSRDVDYDEELQEEEKTFDPRNPRSAFSLFPPEHLLYCEECHDIKCPRCVTEEIICWYCSSCLFETPSSMVRSEGNRCARNCFTCPICTSQLITASIGEGKEGPFILNCNYCMWSTLDIGIKFEKPTNIRAQLDRIANGGKPKPPSKVAESNDPARKSSLSREVLSLEGKSERDGSPEKEDLGDPTDSNSRFHALKSFYKDQITNASAGEIGLPTSAMDLVYSSPSSLARIMNLYTNIGNSSSLKKARQKPAVMREALTPSEGLQLPDPNEFSPSTPDFMDSVSSSQRAFQYPSFIGNPDTRSVSGLRPMPSLLRTKRSKRCAACKHILVKPEFKPTSTRYRIKLVALNYIPLVSLKPVPVSGGLRPSGLDGSDIILEPNKPSQWIMTLKNPLFENVSVSLGSPSVTPGRHGHRVTILCPQFEIGKTGDVWDDALNNPLSKRNSTIINPSSTAAGTADQLIAGKLYDQGRNWASIVIEIVPASIVKDQSRELEEDEDVIEIPIRVRLQWKVTEEDEEGGTGLEEKRQQKQSTSEKALDDGAAEVDDGTRELSYWMVLGVARVAC